MLMDSLGQKRKYGTLRMACACSIVSEVSVGRTRMPEGARVGIIWRFLQTCLVPVLALGCHGNWAQRGVPTCGLFMWLGLPPSMVAPQ